MVGEVEQRERFAFALQQAIKVRGISERQLAKQLGLDPRRIAKWRSGSDLPNLFESARLAETLRVSEELFRNPPAVPPPPPEPYYPIEEYLLDAIAQGGSRGLRGSSPVREGEAEPAEQPPRRRSRGR